ncbi:hypothetical protein D3C71_1251700 [compost metagenome]
MLAIQPVGQVPLRYGVGLGDHGLQRQADLAREEPGHHPHEQQQGADAHSGEGRHHVDAAKQAAAVLLHEAEVHLHQGVDPLLQLGVAPVGLEQRVPGLLLEPLHQQAVDPVDRAQVVQPLLLGPVEHLALVLGPDGGLIGAKGALHLGHALLDAAATGLHIGGVLDHQQGKLGAAHIGDVVEQGFHRDHARQGGIGEIEYPIPYSAQLAGEEKTEYHVDGGDNRKDHGNLLADGEVLVRHVGW